MSKYNFENVIDRNNTASVKVDKDLVKENLDLNYYEDTIPMWVADMDFACPPEIVSAIKSRADRQIMGYTHQTEEYYNSIINWYKRRHNMDIKADTLIYSNGTVTAIRNCLRAFTEEGDGVIIQPPVYYPFEAQIRETKRNVVRNVLICNKDNKYSIDFEDFTEKCKDPKNKMFIYCNPHNPVGNVWSPKETERLLEICEENDVIFFSDEIHCDLIREDSEFESALNMSNHSQLVVATAVNKTFNVAGLHITNLVIENEKLRNRYMEYTGWIGISPFAHETTITAYNSCEDWVENLNNIIDENMSYIETFIAEKMSKVKFVKPQGTYLVWLDFRAFDIPEDEMLNIIAEEARLILEGGTMFGECGRGFIRMNVACPKHILVDALNRLASAFEDK